MPSENHPARASQPSTPVDFDVPAGACDCHTHIHGAPATFPYFAGRVYTPEPASPEEMSALRGPEPSSMVTVSRRDVESQSTA